jgi:hypothetical protein
MDCFNLTRDAFSFPTNTIKITLGQTDGFKVFFRDHLSMACTTGFDFDFRTISIAVNHTDVGSLNVHIATIVGLESGVEKNVRSCDLLGDALIDVCADVMIHLRAIHADILHVFNAGYVPVTSFS